MDNKRKNPKKETHSEIDEMINQLLDKTRDRELEVELHGYPADCLDTPTQLEEKRQFIHNPLVDGADYFAFELLRLTDKNVYTSAISNSPTSTYLLDFGMKKAWISGKKLRSLLDMNAKDGFIQQNRDGSSFVINLSTRLLLDCADRVE